MVYQLRPNRVMREWGYFEVLGITPTLKFKKLVMLPGKSTSVQFHHHRSEFWTVLSGSGAAYIDGAKYKLEPEQMCWVNPGIIHQLCNTGGVPLMIHEVQQGDYLEEDDIVRLAPEALNMPKTGLPSVA